MVLQQAVHYHEAQDWICEQDPFPANLPGPPLAVPTPGVLLQYVPEGQGERPCRTHLPEHTDLLSIFYPPACPLALPQVSPV